MKKIYSKPEILFEDFTVSTNIAAGCETITTLAAPGSCGYPLRGSVLFASEATGCSTKSQESSGTDGSQLIGVDTVCYHVPIGDNNLFES